jgi:hypothetical protein
MIKILHSEPFQPLGPAIPKPAPAAPKSVEIRPGIWRNPDGKLSTTIPIQGPRKAPARCHDESQCGGFYDACATEAGCAGATPLPVLPNALGDGWIAHDGSRTCPIPNAEDGEYEVRWSDGSVDSSGWAMEWRWHYDVECDVNLVAYRLIP